MEASGSSSGNEDAGWRALAIAMIFLLVLLIVGLVLLALYGSFTQLHLKNRCFILFSSSAMKTKNISFARRRIDSVESGDVKSGVTSREATAMTHRTTVTSGRDGSCAGGEDGDEWAGAKCEEQIS